MTTEPSPAARRAAQANVLSPKVKQQYQERLERAKARRAHLELELAQKRGEIRAYEDVLALSAFEGRGAGDS